MVLFNKYFSAQYFIMSGKYQFNQKYKMQNFTKYFLSLFFVFGLAADINAQSISPTNVRSGDVPCWDCVPTNWFDFGGTPDMSNRNNTARNSGNGTGDAWTNAPLKLPPNGHTQWITIRDIGSAGTEESVGTNITGLTIGREYELVAYTMTALSNGSNKYSPKYIDKFDYQLASKPRVTVTSINKDTDTDWGVSRLRFIADATTMQFAFYPGNGAANNNSFESVNISVTLNAINTIPVAQDQTATTDEGVPVMVNVITDAIEYDAGQQIVVSSIDLDPSTPGIQNTITTAEGTWTVNHTTGDVTFIPVPGFSGVATIPYTIQDNYTLDGNPSPGTSNPKTISVTVAAAPVFVDLDSDNDGISDCVEKQLDGATMNTLFDLSGTAQSNNEDNSVPANTIRLTENAGDQAGAAWSKNKINFAQSFTIRYQARLSNGSHNGADGIATVFHNDPAGQNAVGEEGFGIGAATIVNGIALEMDTYQNNSSTGDIADNHGMIWDTDGSPTNGTDTFTGPDGVVNLTDAVSLGNLEDGVWRDVVVTWDASTRTLSYTVGGINAGTYTHSGTLDDFCETYFGIPSSEANKLVYYGYTASTGGETNEQSIRILNPCQDYPQFVDTDGDGIEDYLDLDSDGDGCPDAIEGDKYITQDMLNLNGSIMGSEDVNGIPLLATGGQGAGSAYDSTVNACDEEICTESVQGQPFSWNYPSGTPSPVTETFNQPATNYGFVLDIYYLDNSFNMEVNGTKIATNELEFQSSGTPAPGINVRFADGDVYETNTTDENGDQADIWEMHGDADHPLIRVVINPDGTVALFGSKQSYGPLFPLELFNGNSLQPITWNATGGNTIVATQNVVGVTAIDGTGYGRNIVPCACYNPASTPGTGPDTKVGISLLKRAGNTNTDNWPMVRKSGHVALESNTQGFVITRMSTAEITNNITDPKEGMMVYDKDDHCLKIFADGVWSCFNKPACP